MFVSLAKFTTTKYLCSESSLLHGFPSHSLVDPKAQQYSIKQSLQHRANSFPPVILKVGSKLAVSG